MSGATITVVVARPRIAGLQNGDNSPPTAVGSNYLGDSSSCSYL